MDHRHDAVTPARLRTVSEAAKVRVELRGNVIAEASTLHERDDGTSFLALDPPPPVGSRLVLFGGEGPGRTFEVRGTIAHEGERGCVGRFVEDSGTGQAIGSEHIAPQNIASVLAVAAPVAVTDEPTGVVEMLSGRKRDG